MPDTCLRRTRSSHRRREVICCRSRTSGETGRLHRAMTMLMVKTTPPAVMDTMPATTARSNCRTTLMDRISYVRRIYDVHIFVLCTYLLCFITAFVLQNGDIHYSLYCIAATIIHNCNIHYSLYYITATIIQNRNID